MWIDVPLDNGEAYWGIEQNVVMVTVSSIHNMTDAEIGFCVRALAPLTERITPYLCRGMHFASIEHFHLFYQAEQKALAEAEKRRQSQRQLRRELAVVYEQTYLFLSERDGLYCQSCRTTGQLQIDHITPISKGGTNAKTNLQLLCKVCNIKKGNRG